MSARGMLMYDKMNRSMSGDIGKYYDVPSLDEFKNSNATAKPTLKPGYTRSTAKMEGEGVGNLVYSQDPQKVKTSGGMRNNYPTYGMSTGAYIYKTPVAKAAAAPAPAPAPAPKPAPKPVPIQLSKEVATAIGRSQAYQDTLMVRGGDYVIGGDESVISDFNQQTEQNTKEASKPYFERDVDPKVAQSYADKHKLTLGGDFVLNKIA